MDLPVSTGVLAFYLTNKCTLKCKLCAFGVPYFTSPRNLLKEDIVRDIQRAMELYDDMLHVDILGGEPLLHPDILEITQELYKYRSKFPEMRIVTNCTIIPNDDLCLFIKHILDDGHRFLFLLDNYGSLSSKLKEVKSKLDQYQIPFRVDDYVGDNPRFDGWINYGDFEDRGYTADEVQKLYIDCRCRSLRYHECYDGKIYACPYYLVLGALGKIEPLSGEYVDLRNNSVSNQQQRKILHNVLSQSHNFASCWKCFGLTDYSKRYPAAEQLK